MPCKYPLQMFRQEDGSLTSRETGQTVKTVMVPCGRCMGCRIERSRQWAVRIMHETKLHETNCFITLTYSPENLPRGNGLMLEHTQKFIDRLRKRIEPQRIRFYLGGEYGDSGSNPHYHAIIFNYDFPDKYPWKKSGQKQTYRSPMLESLWPFGFSLIGDVTFASAQYCAQYCTKKITGDRAKEHYRRQDSQGTFWIKPEFATMSLKPGIGLGFYEKYKSDIYPHDYVVTNGSKAKPPKYYDKLFKKEDPAAFQDIKDQREFNGDARRSDNTDARLAVKARVLEGKTNFYKSTKKDKL